MHTEEQVLSDTAHGGGVLFFGPGDIVTYSTSTLAVMTRTGTGIWAFVRTGGGGAETHYFRGDGGLLRRLLTDSAYLQQQFGGSVGPLPAPGRPPFVGSTTQLASWLTPPTTAFPVPKGVAITSIDVIYSATTQNLNGVPVLALYKPSYVNNTAAATVVTPALGAPSPAFSATARANLWVVNVPVTTPVFDNTADTDVFPEVTFVFNAATVLTFYGFNIYYNFNYD